MNNKELDLEKARAAIFNATNHPFTNRCKIKCNGNLPKFVTEVSLVDKECEMPESDRSSSSKTLFMVESSSESEKKVDVPMKKGKAKKKFYKSKSEALNQAKTEKKSETDIEDMLKEQDNWKLSNLVEPILMRSFTTQTDAIKTENILAQTDCEAIVCLSLDKFTQTENIFSFFCWFVDVIKQYKVIIKKYGMFFGLGTVIVIIGIVITKFFATIDTSIFKYFFKEEVPPTFYQNLLRKLNNIFQRY